MITTSILFLIFTNALSGSKVESEDSSIFYSRITLGFLIGTILICYNNLYVLSLGKGVGMYHGLFNISSLTQSITLFVLFITFIILCNNSFYHRKIYLLPKNGGLKTSINDKLSLSKSPLNILFKHENEEPYKALPDTKAETYQIVEYALIMNFVLCGALFLMTSHDLISLFISIELQSYALYILSTLHKNSERATWGGLTYFLLGGLSSCFILLGMCLIYINTGNTSLDGFYIINSITEVSLNNISHSDISNSANNVWYLPKQELNIVNSYYINIALTIFIVGFLFKVSAAPFHFWSPDVYDAIPTVVTTYVAIIAKLSIFAFLLEIVYYVKGDFVNLTNSISWKNCLLISSLLSLIVGSILGLTQFRIKRLYAYSTISHVGFILLALAINSIESIQAYIFYILSYSLSNLNAFVIVIAIGYQLYLYIHKDTFDKPEAIKAMDYLNKVITRKNLENIEKSAYKNFANKDINILLKYQKSRQNVLEKGKTKSYLDNYFAISYDKAFQSLNLKDVTYCPIQLTNQLKGYFYINPYLSLSLAITLFSFIGIPPLIGFFAKQMVLSAALDNGYIFITLVGIITSVIGAGYYLNIVKIMFFYKPDYVLNPLVQYNKITYILSMKAKKDIIISLSSSISLIISLLTLFIAGFIFIPNESFSVARIIAILIFV